MARSTKKIIIFSILGLVAIGGAVGYYLYNKGPVDVKHSSGTKVVATELYQSFSKDSLSAQKKYSNKILEVSGLVKQISKNQQGESIVLLTTNEGSAYINCTMEGPSDAIKEKDVVTIKGICTGIGMGDADLGILGDVYLGRCYLIQ